LTEVAAPLRKKDRLPEYLRIPGGGRQSAIERRMKEQMLAYPTSQALKTSQVIEPELDMLRTAATLEHNAKRREARQLRRLQRRCRVKANEDLDKLLVCYPPEECLRQMSDPADQEAKFAPRRQSLQLPSKAMHLPSKDFFGEIRARQRPALPVLAPLAATWRVGGAAPHTVR